MTTTVVPNSLDGLRTAVADVIEQEPSAVLVHGSVALGLATPISDADVLVIHDGPTALPHGRVLTVADRFVHVEHAAMSALTTSALEHLLIERILDTNHTLTRLGTAVPLIDPTGAGAALVRAFAAWRPPLIVNRKITVEALGFLNDAVGNAEAHQDDVADNALRLLAASLAKLRLLNLGVSVVAFKWQPALLERVDGEALVRYRAIAGLGERLGLSARVDEGRRWLHDLARSTGVAR